MLIPVNDLDVPESQVFRLVWELGLVCGWVGTAVLGTVELVIVQAD